MKILILSLIFAMTLIQQTLQAQEYLILENEEVVAVSIQTIEKNRIVFKKLSPEDTTSYFIKSESVIAIGMGIDAFSKAKTMRNIKTSWLSGNDGQSYFIVPREGEVLQVKIDSINQTSVFFHFTKTADTTGYFLKKESISLISKFDLKEKSIKNELYSLEGLMPSEIRKKAYEDASGNYKKYTTSAHASFIAGLTVVYGLPVPLVTSLIEPADHNLDYPVPQLMENKTYKKAYLSKAHSIKAGKAWTYYAAGAGTTFGLSVIVIFLMAATR